MELMDVPFILLLDASAPARTQLALQLPPCRVLHAENCEEALTFLHTCPVSLVLADFTRPASQGPQLLARMQLEPTLSAIPALALVSLENETAVEQAYACGAFDTAAVPVLSAVIYRRVLNILRALPLCRPTAQGSLYASGLLGQAAMFLRENQQKARTCACTPHPFTLSQLSTLTSLFQAVRLIVPGTRHVYTVTHDGHMQPEEKPCFSFWNRSAPCDNCLCDRSPQGSSGKFEYVREQFYHALSCPVVVDGRSYTLELILSVPESMLLDLYSDADLNRVVEEYNQKLYIDSLTGVYNRRYYDERAPFLGPHDGLAMLDLDNFKMVNDRFGHEAGDRALQAVAGTLLACVRKTDAVIRYGGDEFAIIFRDIPPDVFSSKLETIRECSYKTALGLPGGLHLTVSVGGVMGPGPTASLVRRADALMYRAKETRNRVVVDSSPSHCSSRQTE